jgi:hypothetical protein
MEVRTMSSAAPVDAKPDEPRSFIEKVGPTLTIGLTAIAAVFGSMSAGALQQAMYWKSQAAQDQSKSADQWSYAGFKRDRALIMEATARMLQAASDYAVASFSHEETPPITVPKDDKNPEETRKKLEEAQHLALGWLQKREGPQMMGGKIPETTDEHILALKKAIETREPETELVKLASQINQEAINKAIDDLEKFSAENDKYWDAAVKAAGRLANFNDNKKPDTPANRKARQAAGYELEERRYRIESRINQNIGFLYDIRVKVSSAESDRYRKKSYMLSYAMLIAQIGAVASSLALARKKRSMLWIFVAIFGFVALGFGGYALIPTSLLGR